MVSLMNIMKNTIKIIYNNKLQLESHSKKNNTHVDKVDIFAFKKNNALPQGYFVF